MLLLSLMVLICVDVVDIGIAGIVVVVSGYDDGMMTVMMTARGAALSSAEKCFAPFLCRCRYLPAPAHPWVSLFSFLQHKPPHTYPVTFPDFTFRTALMCSVSSPPAWDPQDDLSLVFVDMRATLLVRAAAAGPIMGELCLKRETFEEAVVFGNPGEAVVCIPQARKIPLDRCRLF